MESWSKEGMLEAAAWFGEFGMDGILKFDRD